MAKISFNNITNGNNIQGINDNFDMLKGLIDEKILFRDNPPGEPNQIQTPQDANGLPIYNLPEPTINHQAANKKYVDDRTIETSEVIDQINNAVTASQTAVAAAGQSGASAASSAASASTATSQANRAEDEAVRAEAARDGVFVVIGGIGYEVPVVYQSGLTMSRPTQTVEYQGNTYAPLASVVPFVTTGAFEVARFRLIQGVSGADMALPTFSAQVGYIEAGAGSQAWTLQDRLRTQVNLAGSMTAAERADAAGPSVLDHTAALLAACAKAGPRGAMIVIPDGYRLNIKRVSAPAIWLHCAGTCTINALPGATVVGQALLDANDLRLLGDIKIDGRANVDRLLQANLNMELQGLSLKSVVGTPTRFGCLLRAPVGCKLRVKSMTLDDVTGVENGVIGDMSGSDCGIYVESDDFIIEDITATNIGGFEDGDVIRIQLVADAELLWARVKTGVIRNINAVEFKKRVVKYQASGGVIDGVFASSSASSATDSPYAAIDLYGSRTTVRNSKVETARAVACCIDNGINNTIESTNSFNNAVGTGFTTARGSTLSALRTIGSSGTVIDGPQVACGGPQTVYIQNSTATRTAVRLQMAAPANHIAIYVDGGTRNTQRGSSLSGTSGAKLQFAVYVAAATYNLAEGNQIDNCVAAIRYLGVVWGSKNRNNIFGSGVNNVVDYTGVDTTSAQTIADSDGSVTASVNSGGNIAVGAVYSQVIPWPPVGSGAIVVGGPVTALETGLVVLPPITSANTITVRIMNVAASPLAAAARNWRFRTPA